MLQKQIQKRYQELSEEEKNKKAENDIKIFQKMKNKG